MNQGALMRYQMELTRRAYQRRRDKIEAMQDSNSEKGCDIDQGSEKRDILQDPNLCMLY